MGKIDGYKTYICAALIVGAGVLKYFGYIDEGTMQAMLTVLGGATVASMRSGIKKAEK